MTLKDLLIDKRIVQRNIEQGKLDAAEYQKLLEALPDLTDKVWRRPEGGAAVQGSSAVKRAVTPAPIAPARSLEHAAAAGFGASVASAADEDDIDDEDDDDDDDTDDLDEDETEAGLDDEGDDDDDADDDDADDAEVGESGQDAVEADSAKSE